MKLINTMLLAAALCCATLCQAQITLNATSGTPSGSYSTLKVAFDAINFGIHKGQISILINGNVTETVTAELRPSGGLADYTKVTIMPTTTCTVSGVLLGPVIYLRGADSVLIDGRIGGTGNTRSLTIENSCPTTIGSYVSALRVDSMATHDTVRYINFKSISHSIHFGPHISHSLLDHNDFAGIGAGLQLAAIVAGGGSNNTITNNMVHDFSTYGLTMIWQTLFPTDFIIQDNSFYQTGYVGVNSTYMDIRGAGHTVNRNYLGGSAPNAAGTAAQHTVVTGINCASNSIVDSNVITNFDANAFTGILASGGNIGTDHGNIIGSATDTGAIRASAAAGISISGLLTCSNNYIGGLTSFFKLKGMSLANGHDSLLITDNTIGGSLATCLKLYGPSNSNDSLAGMEMASARGKILQNTVSHLYNFSNSANANPTTGISCAASGFVEISDNIVTEIHANRSQLLAGIILRQSTSNGETRTVSNNTISNLSTSVSSSAPSANIYGLSSLTNQGTNLIYNNTISNISDTATSSSGVSSTGIYIGPAFSNAGVQIIRKNTITNLTSTSSHPSSSASGIITVISYNGTVTIDSNDIDLITGASSNTATSQVVAAQGIGVFKPTNGIIAANHIRNISCISPAATTVAGINTEFISNTNPIVIVKNRIYKLNNDNSSGGSIAGIIARGSGGSSGYGNGAFSIINNMVTLTPVDDTKVYGITNPLPAGEIGVYFNSVYIGGTSIGNNVSSALSRVDYAYTNMDIRDNILMNERTGGTTGHYGIINDNVLPSAGWVTSNSNNLYTSNAGMLASWAGTALDFAGYRTLSSKDSCSVNQTVDFTNIALGDLHLQNSAANQLLRGTAISTLSTDIDNDVRHSSPSMGADELFITSQVIDIAIHGPTTLCGGDSVRLIAPSSADLQWFKDGVLIPGAVNEDTLTVYDAGSYQAVHSNLCFTDSSNLIIITESAIDSSVIQNDDTLTAITSGTYQWVDCNNGFSPISGATTQSYIASQPGAYAVIITVGNCADTSACIVISGIPNNAYHNLSAQLHPNPGGNEVRLSLGKPLNDGSVTFVNSLGQTMLRSDHLKGAVIRLNTEHLAQGVYTIQLRDKGASVTMKWVKSGN